MSCQANDATVYNRFLYNNFFTYISTTVTDMQL